MQKVHKNNQKHGSYLDSRRSRWREKSSAITYNPYEIETARRFVDTKRPEKMDSYFAVTRGSAFPARTCETLGRRADSHACTCSRTISCACNGWVRMVMTGQETPAGRQRAASGHCYLQSPRNIGVTTLRNDQGRCKPNQFLSNCTVRKPVISIPSVPIYKTSRVSAYYGARVTW